MTYRALDPGAIIGTCETLRSRVTERFPESGLSRVAAELLLVARGSVSRLERLRSPSWPIRSGVILGLFTILAATAGLILSIPAPATAPGVVEFLQGLESGINDVVFLGVAVFFLITLEGRIKRRAALRVLHELRSIAHVVDMHQLTKDPEMLLSPAMATRSSPRREMTRFELARYLDYCSEMLSLTSKLAALFAQYFDDPVILNAVNDIQALTTGLSAKIWQKIVILDTVVLRAEAPQLRADMEA